MEPLHLAHLIFVSFWGGVIAAETVVELALREGDAAEVHYWIDVFIEGPLLVAILTSGGILMYRAWPPTPLHVIKAATALIAVAVNGWCLLVVIARRRHKADAAALRRYTRQVRWAGAAVPFGLAAAYIGLHYFT